MNAADVMTSNVITISPDASILDLATLLLANRISAVPVIGERGELEGIVSEGDVLRRVEVGTERRRSWWLAALATNEELAADFVKSHAGKVADIMTRRVVTARMDTPIAEIASLLERHAIKRVPIMDAGKVVGIVSRANLVQALASAQRRVAAGTAADDAGLRQSIERRLSAQAWARPWLLNVIVCDGTAELWGIVESQAEKDAARVAAESTPGVRAVNDRLIVRQIASRT